MKWKDPISSPMDALIEILEINGMTIINDSVEWKIIELVSKELEDEMD